MMRTSTQGATGGRVPMLALFLTTLVVGLSLFAADPAQAKTFTVTSTQDFSDVDPGDGICDTLSVQLLNPCTLRGAIQEANAYPGADKIYFDIPLGGVHTIEPNVGLPVIKERVTIDGYTQPGATENTIAKGATNAKLLVELSGVDAGQFSSGITVLAPNCVVRVLVIKRFGGSGVGVGGSASGTKVEGNFLGTDPSGTLDRGNANVGVAQAIDVVNSNNTVGGASPAARNLISGNGDDGIEIAHHTTGLDVVGNLIGTQKNGTSSLGNTGDGVAIGSDEGVTLSENTIAFNGEDGVLVAFGESNSILSNSIHSNTESGIDLVPVGQEEDDGATPNDLKDPDTGANNLQNKPVLTSATTSGRKTTIEGTLNSKPKKTFTIQFFSNPAGNEGKKLIGQKNAATNANGTASFTFSTAQAVQLGRNITATATDPDGNTSEFSGPRSVTPG